MSFSLRSLLVQATPEYFANIGYDGQWGENLDQPYAYQNIFSFGSLNQDLATARQKHPRSRHPEPRSSPLNREVLVHGEFLLLTFLDHDGYFILQEFADRASLEEAICALGGVWNGYVAFQVAYFNGVARPYRIFYTDWQGNRKRLNKSCPDPPAPEDSESGLPQAIEIEWFDSRS